jgi:hypothetical protein
MAPSILKFNDVIYDATTRRFEARAVLADRPQRPLWVSTPGHPQWSFAQISSALAQAVWRNGGQAS